MRKQKLSRREYYRRIIAKQESEGLSVREICEQESISSWTFYMWRKRLRENERENQWSRDDLSEKSAFIPVSITGEGFMPQSLLLEIRLSNGNSLKIPAGFPVEQVESIYHLVSTE